MALFFFDVTEDEELLPDRQGSMFDHQVEAQAHATEIAIAFLRQATPTETDFLCSITVRNDQRAALYEITLRGSHKDEG